jgi:predicted CoA-substrate-specific enzyme activase
MITAGIDAGLENIKIVIADNGKIIAKGTCPSGGEGRTEAIRTLFDELLERAGLRYSDLSKTVATGQGKYDALIADKGVVEAVAAAAAAGFFFKDSQAVVDIGADQTRVVTLEEEEGIREVVMNQKCMAGLGLLIETVAERLDMTLEEISNIPSTSDTACSVNDGCPVFAELDALELLNRCVSRESVAAAVMQTVIVRLNSILNDKIRPERNTAVLIGGVGKNAFVVNGLKDRSGIDFIVPDDAEYGGAIGAAVLATK